MARGLGDLDVLMHSLKDCVCEFFDAAKDEFDGYPGCPCRRCVVTGAATWDICGAEFHGKQEDCVCGQLTVATERVFPYITDPTVQSSFPTQQVELPTTGRNCFPSGLAADLNITILRCSSAPQDGEIYVACEVMEHEAWVNSIDLMVLVNAVTCCLSKKELNTKKSKRFLIQQAIPLLSDGMCEGAEIRFTVDLGSLCPCPEEDSP